MEKVTSGGEVSILYVDYGNRATIPRAKCGVLPTAFTSLPAYAKEYSLALVQLAPDVSLCRHLWKILDLKTKFETSGGLRCSRPTGSARRPAQQDTKHERGVQVNPLECDFILGITHSFFAIPGLAVSHISPYVTPIIPMRMSSSNSQATENLLTVLNVTFFPRNLIQEGLLMAEKRGGGRKMAKLISSYQDAMDKAKREHLNIWEYGDITADDAKEFGAGRSVIHLQ